MTIAATAAIIVAAVGIASLKPTAHEESVNRLPYAVFSIETVDLTVTANASESMDPDGSIANYTWDFGDGNQTFGIVSEHAYATNGTYTITLNITDNQNAANTTSMEVVLAVNIEIGYDPIAVIKIVSVVNRTVSLCASDSYDPDGGDITSFEWRLSDGASYVGDCITHTFSENGTFEITLLVTDDDGATGSVSTEVVVTIEVTPPPSDDDRVGPPGLLRAIEDHQDRVDEQPQLQKSLDRLLENLDRWLEKHSAH